MAVGDQARVALAGGEQYKVVEILPRTTAFYRGDRRSPGQEILVAANVQHLLAVVTADYLLNQAGYLEAALIAARRAGLGASIFISKWDLTGEVAQSLLRDKLSLYEGLADCLVMGSAHEICQDLRRALIGMTTVIIGDRGHGKTSVVHAILGASQDQQTSWGKTASTHASQMYFGPEGTALIDTPGFRDLALSGITENERDSVFPEIARLAVGCSFRNCTHGHEPGCQIIEALRQGNIKRERYDAYQGMAGNALKQKDKEKDTPHVDYRHEACVEAFVCMKCGEPIGPTGAGTEHRNHCPRCLSSLHVDNRPGDRGSLCHGIMEPVSVWVRKEGEWAIIHRCRECGALSSNRIAADDNPMLLMSLAVRPLSMPPFPLNTLPSFSG